MLVNQQVAKTAQEDIFMGIRFVGSSSQSTHDGHDKQTIKRLYNDVRRGNNPLGGHEDLDPHGCIYKI